MSDPSPPQEPSPEPSPQKKPKKEAVIHPVPEDLEERLSIAWPNERLAALGIWQVELLAAFLRTEQQELTIPVLEGLLEDIEKYYPEELIPLNPTLKPLLQGNSKFGE